MLAVADLVGSIVLVAVMVTVCEDLMLEGAVYIPFDRVPTEGADQVTLVVELPVTVAVNCILCVARSDAFGGVIVMLMLVGTS